MLTLTLFDLFSHIAVYQMDTGETIVKDYTFPPV